VLDVIDGGCQVSLCDGHDPIGQILWFEAVIGPDNADDWYVDVRKDVGGRPNDRETPKQEDQDSEYHDCVRLL
jgi:hypothetical protein